MRIVLISAALALAADQASKLAILHALDLESRGVLDVLPPLLTFRMGWNTGINFGLFGEGGAASRWIMIAIALAISAMVLAWVREPGTSRLARVSAGLLVGGALGNVIDRVLYGAVVDFLNMSCCGIDNPYVFNIADIAIFAGAIGLALFGGGRKGADGT